MRNVQPLGSLSIWLWLLIHTSFFGRKEMCHGCFYIWKWDGELLTEKLTGSENFRLLLTNRVCYVEDIAALCRHQTIQTRVTFYKCDGNTFSRLHLININRLICGREMKMVKTNMRKWLERLKDKRDQMAPCPNALWSIYNGSIWGRGDGGLL